MDLALTSVMDTPWRHVLGVWRLPRRPEDERFPEDASRHPHTTHSVPWLLELDLGRTSMLWTSDRGSAMRYQGAAISARCASLVCAAVEFGRYGASDLRALAKRYSDGTREALTWASVSDAVGLDPWSAGEWPMRRVLGVLEASPVRLEVLVAEQRARAA